MCLIFQTVFFNQVIIFPFPVLFLRIQKKKNILASKVQRPTCCPVDLGAGHPPPDRPRTPHTKPQRGGVSTRGAQLPQALDSWAVAPPPPVAHPASLGPASRTSSAMGASNPDPAVLTNG